MPSSLDQIGFCTFCKSFKKTNLDLATSPGISLPDPVKNFRVVRSNTGWNIIAICLYDQLPESFLNFGKISYISQIGPLHNTNGNSVLKKLNEITGCPIKVCLNRNHHWFSGTNNVTNRLKGKINQFGALHVNFNPNTSFVRILNHHIEICTCPFRIKECAKCRQLDGDGCIDSIYINGSNACHIFTESRFHLLLILRIFSNKT